MFSEEDMVHLLQSEIDIHRKLKHPHVAQFIQSFEDEKFVYMVQALYPNRSLRDLIKSRKNELSTDECRYFVHQILDGARYIHGQGIIHRDLKLSNIFIDANMQAKIGDFGLAIHLDNPELKIPTLCGTTNVITYFSNRSPSIFTLSVLRIVSRTRSGHKKRIFKKNRCLGDWCHCICTFIRLQTIRSRGRIFHSSANHTC